MATDKMSNLTELADLAANDLLLVTDISEALDIDKSKKVKVSTVKEYIVGEVSSKISVKYVSIIVIPSAAYCSVGDNKAFFPISGFNFSCSCKGIYINLPKFLILQCN